MTKSQFTNVEAYIASFPAEVRQRLEEIRQIVRTQAPDATETIKYDMPCYVLHGNLVYFAAFKSHIGLYSTGAGNETIDAALVGYKTGRGSVQFPHNQPLPLLLIGQIVRFRVNQNTTRASHKRE